MLTPFLQPNTAPGSNVTFDAGAAAISFANVSAFGYTSVNSIDLASVGVIPGGYSILETPQAYDIQTTAAFSGPITIGFKVQEVNDPAEFESLRVLHYEGGQLVDRTIIAPDSPSHDFTSRTIYARVSSLSPFVIARLSHGICPLYDQTRAHKKGSTIPIKVQVCGADWANLSSPNISLTAVGLVRTTDDAPGILEDSGASNATNNFRYDENLTGYVFNLSTKHLSTGTYNLMLKAGGDPTVHSVQFQVR